MEGFRALNSQVLALLVFCVPWRSKGLREVLTIRAAPVDSYSRAQCKQQLAMREKQRKDPEPSSNNGRTGAACGARFDLPPHSQNLNLWSNSVP